MNESNSWRSSPVRALAFRWAAVCWRFRWPILAVWGVIAIVGGVQLTTLDQELRLPDYSISGSESAQTATTISQAFPKIGAEQVAVVLTTRDRADGLASSRGIAQMLAEIEGVSEVIGPTSPLVGGDLSTPDGQTMMILASLEGTVADRDHSTDAINTAISDLNLPEGSSADLTGETPLNKALADVEKQDQARAEIIGLSLAVVLLVIGLRSPLAAIVTLISAGLGVCLASIGIASASAFVPVTQFSLVVATVIGLGVGIDYALFVVSRFREELERNDVRAHDARAHNTIAALAKALQTSGHTVIVSGVIVMVSLCSIIIIDGPVFRDIAVAAGFVVLCCMVTAVTALPAALAILAPKLHGRVRVSKAPSAPISRGRWYRWVGFIQRHPVASGVPAVAFLILLSLPVFGIKLGLDLGIPALAQTDAGRGYATAENAFGGAAVTPIYVTACAPGDAMSDREVTAFRTFVDSAAQQSGVQAVSSVFDALPRSSPGAEGALRELASTPVGRSVSGAFVDNVERPRCLLATVEAGGRVDSPETAALIDELRTTAQWQSPEQMPIQIGGMAAQYRDLSNETATMFPFVIALVLVLSLIYLIAALRSVLVPIKAVILNILATAAAIGSIVSVFQFGLGEDVFDFANVGTIQAFLPVAMFAVLFGLSMDYEVFMVRRIREEYLDCGDTSEAVRRAMQKVAPQITIAGLIMIAVFGSLVVADVLELKQIGFGLAVAILIDITLIRLVLVPVLMSLADTYNWWFPGSNARDEVDEAETGGQTLAAKDVGTG